MKEQQHSKQSLIFYYSPGACSMASHIALEEVHAEYEPRMVHIDKLEHRGADYRKINPRMRVASLVVGNEVITEEVALLSYIARRFPVPKLMPDEPLELGKCLSLMAYIASSIHVTVGHIFRPERYGTDAPTFQNMIKKGREVFWDQLQELDQLLNDKTWAMGEQYTVCDPYILVVYRWGLKSDMPMIQLANLERHKNQMLARPAVRRVYQREGHALH
ncbi:MAG: hypothetical protein WBF88_10905 [Pusillimonas sp.]